MCKKSFAILTLILIPLINLLAQKDSSGAGYALNCLGVNGTFVNVGNILNTLDFPFTIEAWVDLGRYPNPKAEESIFSSDSKDVYSGFWLNVNQEGNLLIEFGDNRTEGQNDTRGIRTRTMFPLNQWVHVAAVCNSIADIQFYYNGVPQKTTTTDGTSGAPRMKHNPGIAEIGNWTSLSGESPFFGQIDEVRIWNTARTMNEIRKNMCSRVAATPGLLDYWRGLGSLTIPRVYDYALTPHNGVIEGHGGIIKVFSGAPIGDYSVARYGAFDVLQIADPSGDTFKVTQVQGNPLGVVAYGVNAPPRKTGGRGLTSFPDHYFGIFCIDSAVPATYRIIYRYANASIGGNPEANARIYSKATDSTVRWLNLGPEPDTASNTIIKRGLSGRGEYILNFVSSTMVLNQPANESNEDLIVSPNPAHNNLRLTFNNVRQPVKVIRIVNVTGKVILEIQNPSNNSSLNLDIANWSSGIYFAEAMTAKGNYFTRFIIQ